MRSQLAADAQPKALAYALATLAVDVLLTTQQQTVKRTLMILARTSDGGRDF
jgi:hypothetical protein